jgi:AcrR family transcriptional regulator
MRKRADSRDAIRDRILRATMDLHDEKGVAPTSFADIAKRAGVGQATVYRHFPTPSELIQTCGFHVWQEMRPPMPEDAAAVFEGSATDGERIERLVAEVDAFYARGAHRLGMAGRDRDIVPELDGFLRAVEAGVEALVRQALSPAGKPETSVKAVVGLMSFPVWAAFSKLDLSARELRRFRVRLITCAIGLT